MNIFTAMLLFVKNILKLNYELPVGSEGNSTHLAEN